jgi:hypothetical protein
MSDTNFCLAGLTQPAMDGPYSGYLPSSKEARRAAKKVPFEPGQRDWSHKQQRRKSSEAVSAMSK